MRRVCLVVIVFAGLSTTAGAASGGSFVLLFGPTDAGLVDTWDLSARFEGSVTVRFAAGFGTGQTVWSPGPTGQLTVGMFRSGKSVRYSAFLASTGPHGVTSRVDRAGGLCTDVQSNLFDQAAVEERHDGVELGLAGTTPRSAGFRMAESRCGGPLADDIGRALRMVWIPAAKLRKGGFDIDLRGSAPLSIPGMTATVDSTVVVHVATKRSTAQPRVSHEKTKAYRQIDVDYALASVRGSMTAAVRGGGLLCNELDSCGAVETTRLLVGAARHATATVTAIAPARRSVADLRSAVGLSASGDPKGISTFGAAGWTSTSSTLSTALLRGGAPACMDTRHAPAFAVSLQRSGKRMNMRLLPDSVIRTVCPGPTFANDATGPPIATASAALSEFGKKRIHLRLRGGAPILTDGWSGKTKATVDLVLVRKRVKIRRVRY